MSITQTNPTDAFRGNDTPIPAEAGTNTDALSHAAILAPREVYPTWLRETITKITNLATLQEDWDSYGALPIDRGSITKACEYICYLAGYVSVDSPAVAGTPDGHIGFSWDKGSWSLDAKILPDGRIEYVYLDERDATNDLDTTTRSWSDFLDLLTQWP